MENTNENGQKKEIKKEELGFKKFLTFFKNYMNVWSLVVAALPIPLTQLKLIPTYASQTALLSLLTTFFCFFIVAIVYFWRHNIGRFLFGEIFSHSDPQKQFPLLDIKNKKFSRKAKFINSLPALLAVLSFVSIFGYLGLLNNSLHKVKPILTNEKDYENTVRLIKENSEDSPTRQVLLDNLTKLYQLGIEENKRIKEYGSFEKYILNTTVLSWIHSGLWLMLLYLLIFITAESAFVLMAMKEYLQNTLHISDLAVLTGSVSKKDFLNKLFK